MKFKISDRPTTIGESSTVIYQSDYTEYDKQTDKYYYIDFDGSKTEITKLQFNRLMNDREVA